jgi:membrane protein YqaA with SNARE-associated domain
MSRKILRNLRSLQKHIDRPWYLPTVALLAFADVFVMIIPTDALLVSAVLVKPRRWWLAGTLVALGSSLAALVLAGAVQWDLDGLTRLFPSLFESPSWRGTDAFLEKYGVWALALFAAGPLPYQPAVILVALSGASLTEISLATLLGRGGKYYVLAYLASHAPRYLERLRSVRREMLALEEAVNTKADGNATAAAPEEKTPPTGHRPVGETRT